MDNSKSSVTFHLGCIDFLMAFESFKFCKSVWLGTALGQIAFPVSLLIFISGCLYKICSLLHFGLSNIVQKVTTLTLWSSSFKQRHVLSRLVVSDSLRPHGL